MTTIKKEVKLDSNNLASKSTSSASNSVRIQVSYSTNSTQSTNKILTIKK